MSRPEGPRGWRGYAAALLITAAAFLFRAEIARLFGHPVSLTLCGLAAVFACIWSIGLGPSLLAAALTSIWFVVDQGTRTPVFWIHDGLYMVEAAAFCVYGRQLRAARDAAVRGENWQRHLVETSGEGIWTVDPGGIVRNANPRIAEMLGCGIHDIVGRPVQQFLFPEDVPAERIRFQIRRPGHREQYDRRLRRADGSELWTLACSSPWSDRGRDAGVLTMMTDITERKQAEQALRRSERKFRELFENVREGVYQTSLDGRILAANQELLRMLGFSNEDELNVPGVVKGTFVDPELHLNLRDRLERAGSYANVEFQLRRRDNRTITVSENARVVRDEDGDILYFEGTLTDITEKKLEAPRHFSQRPVSDLNALLQELEQRLCISLQACDGPVPVFADASHIEQILSGLLTHFRDEGAIDQPIEVSTTIEPAGPFACLRLQGVSTRRPVAALAMSQAILAQHGGVLHVESEPGLLRFAMYLPLAPAS